MLVAEIATTPRRRAPIPGGPTAAALTPAGSSGRVAVIHVEIPVGGGMPEHDHGASEIVLIPLSGTADCGTTGSPGSCQPAWPSTSPVASASVSPTPDPNRLLLSSWRRRRSSRAPGHVARRLTWAGHGAEQESKQVMNASAAAVAAAVTFVWLGMVLAISFLEAPLKFRAPGVTIPIGLGIGRLVFRALNLVEAVFAVTVIAAVIAGRPPADVYVFATVAAALLATQLGLIRPRLNRRSDRVLAGENLPRSHVHLYYVALEIAKVVALAGLGASVFLGAGW